MYLTATLYSQSTEFYDGSYLTSYTDQPICHIANQNYSDGPVNDTINCKGTRYFEASSNNEFNVNFLEWRHSYQTRSKASIWFRKMRRLVKFRRSDWYHMKGLVRLWRVQLFVFNFYWYWYGYLTDVEVTYYFESYNNAWRPTLIFVIEMASPSTVLTKILSAYTIWRRISWSTLVLF